MSQKAQMFTLFTIPPSHKYSVNKKDPKRKSAPTENTYNQ